MTSHPPPRNPAQNPDASPAPNAPASTPPWAALDPSTRDQRDLALRDSEARLRATLHSMIEGMVVHAPDGRVVEANPAACRILGLSHDELMGVKSVDPRWQAVHENGSPWPGLEHPAMMTLRTGLPQRDKVMGIDTPHEGRRWIVINASPIMEAGGTLVLGVVASFADITLQRAQAARLERSRAQLLDLYDNAPCGYHTLDASGRYQRVNATELAWLGLARDDVIGRLSPVDFFTDEGRATFERNFPRLVAGEDLEGIEVELLGRHGIRRWVGLSATAIRDAQGRFLGSRSMLHDHSELKRVLGELARLNAEQTAVLNTTLVGIARVRQRRFTWVNEGTCRIFGHAPHELVGQSTRMIYTSDEDFARVGRTIPKDRAVGQTLRHELQMRRKDGSPVWIDLQSSLLPDSDGESLGVFVNISPMKHAEQERLLRVQLDAENTKLREAAALKTMFLRNMSHELLTPLNAVIGYAGLLQTQAKTLAPDKVLSHGRQIGASGRQLQLLIRRMLDFADLEAQKVEFHPAPLRLSEAIQDVTDMLQDAIQARGIRIDVAVPGELEELSLDPLRLRQVLACLIDNAVKFSPAGTVVRVQAAIEDGDRFRIDVADQGMGIPDVELPLLFTLFHRIGAGNTNTTPGTGLGLALVRRVVQAQGGTVGVRSEPGRGSVFSVNLPRRGVSPPPPAPRPTPSPAP